MNINISCIVIGILGIIGNFIIYLLYAEIFDPDFWIDTILFVILGIMFYTFTSGIDEETQIIFLIIQVLTYIKLLFDVYDRNK